ncbi:MAG TPA: hypothetical protein VGY90_06530 [Steroidobacteraceae bacterium]|nr:hypothetical protein [Steroidobacteraceae bacterium]
MSRTRGGNGSTHLRPGAKKVGRIAPARPDPVPDADLPAAQPYHCTLQLDLAPAHPYTQDTEG